VQYLHHHGQSIFCATACSGEIISTRKRCGDSELSPNCCPAKPNVHGLTQVHYRHQMPALESSDRSGLNRSFPHNIGASRYFLHSFRALSLLCDVLGHREGSQSYPRIGRRGCQGPTNYGRGIKQIAAYCIQAPPKSKRLLFGPRHFRHPAPLRSYLVMRFGTTRAFNAVLFAKSVA